MAPARLGASPAVVSRFVQTHVRPRPGLQDEGRIRRAWDLDRPLRGPAVGVGDEHHRPVDAAKEVADSGGVAGQATERVAAAITGWPSLASESMT